MVSTLKSRLPSIYHHLLAGVVDETYPDERFATCGACVNCQSSISPLASTKCCSYYPTLPNYLVGGILANQGMSGRNGRERALALIASGTGVTPYGLLRTVEQARRRRRLMPEGRVPTRAEAESLLCSFYDQGQCSVWDYREHLCATYFCYSVGGEAGERFWRALNQFLQLVERELCLHALVCLGWPAGQLRLADPLADWDASDGRGTARRRAQPPWRDWEGRGVDLYVECHRIVAALEPSTVAALIGWKGALLESRLRATLSQFRTGVSPELLRKAAEVRMATATETEVDISAPGFEPTRIPRLVARFLSQFDGVRTTTQVVRLAASVNVDVAHHIAPLRAAGVLVET